jgi:hypothetical protein
MHRRCKVAQQLLSRAASGVCVAAQMQVVTLLSSPAQRGFQHRLGVGDVDEVRGVRLQLYICALGQRHITHL